MEVVLTLACHQCKKTLQELKTSAAVGSYAIIEIDDILDFAGLCCSSPYLYVTAKIQQTTVIVASEEVKDGENTKN